MKGKSKIVRVQKWNLVNPMPADVVVPKPVEGSEYLIDADVVVVAVGVSPNPIVLPFGGPDWKFLRKVRLS